MTQDKCKCGLLLKLSGDAAHCSHCGRRIKPIVLHEKIKRRMFHGVECVECPHYEARVMPIVTQRYNTPTCVGHCKLDDAYLTRSVRPRPNPNRCAVRREAEAA